MVRYAPSIAFIANVDLTKIIEQRRPTLSVNLLLRHLENKLKEMIKDNIQSWRTNFRW